MNILHESSPLREALSRMPVVDTHEHFHLVTDDHGYDLIDFLYTNTYTCTMASFFDPQLVGTITDASLPLETRYAAFCSAYNQIRSTRTGRTVREVVRLWGIDDVRPDNLVQLQAAHANRLQTLRMPEQICACIVNSAGHPLYGYVRGLRNYIEGKMPCPDRTYVNPCITGLHSIAAWRDVEDIACVMDTEIGSVAELVEAAQRIMRACVAAGAVGFKDVYTYFRAWEIGSPDRAAAERDFAAIRRGGAASGALSDYLFYQVYDTAQQLDRPMGIHTGATITSAEPAGCLHSLHPVIRAFPKLAFDLYHFNYPLLEPYVLTLKSFPNVYANGAWIAGSGSDFVKRFLREALYSLPADRVMVYGGDCHCAGEMVCVTLKNALQAVDDVLSGAVQSRYLSVSEAEEVAKLWLSGSAERLYRLPASE